MTRPFSHVRRLLSHNGHGSRRRGASAVEFALVAPVFFTVVLGIIEFGRAMMVCEVLTNAAGIGARTGAISGTDTATILNTVSNSLSDLKINGATVTVKVNGSAGEAKTAVTGDTIQVTVSVPFASVSWLSKASFLADRTLTSSAVIRRE